MLEGKKTYIAGAMLLIGAIGALIQGDKELAALLFPNALAVLGIGHKVDRLSEKVSN